MRLRAKFAMLTLSAAVLAGAWLLAVYMSGEAETETEAMAETEPVSVSLAVGSSGELTALSWSWEEQTVNLARDEKTGRWVNADDETCPVDTRAADALALAAADVTATMAVGETTELSQYGLDAPALTVVAATEDQIAGYEVGNMSITGEFYLRRSGENTVYLENGGLAAAFRVGLEDILALESVPEDIAAVRGLAVTSEAESYSLLWFQGGEPGWYRTDGGTRTALEEEKVRQLYETLTELELTRCVDWDGDPEDYGLGTPQSTASVRYLDSGGRMGSFTLEFGDYAGSDVYVRFADSGMVYLVPGAVADAVMYPRWETMTPMTVLPLAPEDVASFTLELGGHRYEIVRLEETAELPAAEGTEAISVTDVIYSSNGWVLDTERMDDWFADLSALTGDSLAPESKGRQTVLTASVAWRDEEEETVVELRNYDSAHYLCLSGDRRLLVPREPVDKLIEEAERILLIE